MSINPPPIHYYLLFILIISDTPQNILLIKLVSKDISCPPPLDLMRKTSMNEVGEKKSYAQAFSLMNLDS